jgi:lysophospholipase L1-like esterase
MIQMSIAARTFVNALSKLLASALLVLLLFPQLAFSAAMRIMPLGDSITVGSNSGVIPYDSGYYISYRKALRDRLVSAGYEINYVGSQSAGDAVFTDAQHEGHGGWYADGPSSTSIRPNVYEFLANLNKPVDVVLLHIGTNDIDDGQDPADVAAEVNDILNEIDTYEQDVSKDVWVVLALIINNARGCVNRDRTTVLNDAVDLIASERLISGDKILVVDMEIGAGLDYDISPQGDMYDCLHPYKTGYKKMAEAWYQGLLEILPRANAGLAQNANPGASVTLDGTESSDSLGTIVAYAWSQIGGSPTVTLANANTALASFTAPSVSGGATLTFRLTITDDKDFSHSDECSVTVNGPPVADAGADQQVSAGAAVVLDGTQSSDADGSVTDYRWAQVGGSPVVTLTGADTSRARFMAPVVGSGAVQLTFQLTVSDDFGVQSVDTVVVEVNGPPIEDHSSGSGGGGGGCFITAAGDQRPRTIYDNKIFEP